MPFLENVTRGRGIPRERLASVAEHYLHFGGVSPINGINRTLIDTDPQAETRPARLLRQPQLGALCRGHRRDHARQRDSPGGRVHHVGMGRLLQLHPVRRGHRTGPRPRPARLRRNWSNCASTSTTRCSSRCSPTPSPRRRRRCRECAARGWCSPRIPFPLRPRSRCGPDLYSRQVAYASRLVATAAGYDDYDQVWQSRSGPPQVPWLEPDVADHLTTLAEGGTEAVIVCPIGFVADHIEVVWDLDNELRQQAEDAGHRVCAGGHAQRRPAVRAAGRRSDRRAARRPRTGQGARARMPHRCRAFRSTAWCARPNCG